MPLFFFHLRRQEHLEPDLEGITLSTIEDAKEEAALSLREFVADELRAGQSDISAIEIADSMGDVVATVTIDEAVLKPLNH